MSERVSVLALVSLVAVSFPFPPFGVISSEYVFRLGSAASFNLFFCPVNVCLVVGLSSTVYVGAGVQFPQSVSVLVHCPV